MSTQKNFWQLCAAGLFVLTLLSYRELTHQSDGKFHAYFLDVGQGDSILLVSPSGKQILIDGGPDLTTLEHLGEKMPFFDREIELMILTHPDADHVTALPEIIKRYEVSSILMNGTVQRSGRYDAMLYHIMNQGVAIIEPDPQTDIDMGDGLVLDIVWPLPGTMGTETKHPNDASVVVRALYGETSILLSGDIEKRAEEEILASGIDVRASILKAGHHGSRSSSSTGFLLAVDPDIVIISAGEDNSYGHPHAEVLRRFERMGIEVRNTAEEGTISMEFEG